MVSALFQSRPNECGGTRKFTIGQCSFGWSMIEDLHTRELERIKAGQCSRVPKLRVMCNVTRGPASTCFHQVMQVSKINVDILHCSGIFLFMHIQQDEVLAELKEYVHNNPKAPDASAVIHTIAYLEALNKILERSFLGVKVKVFEANGYTMQRINEGYQFFTRWARESDSGKEGEEKPTFLAWQV